MAEIKAVINDIDGNLIMTEEACWHLENDIFRQMGVRPMSREIHQSSWGMKLDDAVAVRSDGLADLETFWRLFPASYQEFVDAGRLDVIAEDNLEALRQIRAKNIGHMVLTSRKMAEMKHLMKLSTGLAKWTDAFYYNENMRFHKPDPRAFEHIEVVHGLKPDQCVYVGDQPTDAMAANGAGLWFIANLEEGLRTKDDFRDHRVDLFIERFTELPEAIKLLDKSIR